MKKRLLALAAALSLGVASFVSAAELELSGEEVYLNETREVTDWGSIRVRSAEAVDSVTAPNPAEDCMVIKAKSGKKLLHFALTFGEYGNDAHGVMVSNAVICKLITGDGNEYKGRMMIDANTPDGKDERTAYNSADKLPEIANYLVNVDGFDFWFSRNNGYSDYAWYDYVAEVPEELLNHETPIALSMTLNETTFYYIYQ